MRQFYFLLIFIVISTQNLYCQTPLLRNGRYLIDYKSEKVKDCSLLIKDSTYLTYDGNDSITGQIKWLDSDTFVLRDSIKKKENGSEIVNLLNKSFGEVCFKIQSRSKDRFDFRTTYVGQLHITLNEGVIRSLNLKK